MPYRSSIVTLKTKNPLQKPEEKRLQCRAKTKAPIRKTACGSDIVISKVKQLQGKKLVQVTEVYDTEKIKKHF